ncbi:DUF305 domain-containing protein [Jiangella anatolica]|uniref:DUF305 domain-containing protein n=1 Tax=Jiangella anatolica TaxID=2670374 RepID=A0A2W2C714_9ACTN|nr:DUF305 domain-containing protein [Jiangella anatolica]PZF83907.1 DUF305 domain-containing protein [Jiangella anatolica]
MHRKRFTLPIVAIALAGAVLAGCGSDSGDDTGGGTVAPGDSATTASSNAADVEFAQAMIVHHTQAVEMARMVPANGVSAELTELAAAVEAAQQPEIDQLTAMLDRWGADAAPTGGGGGGHAGHGGGDTAGMEGMMSAEDMDALAAATGAEFERLWLTMMIEHHEGAIAMAGTELADGADAEAQALAQTIVDAQQAEITRMEELLQAS